MTWTLPIRTAVAAALLGLGFSGKPAWGRGRMPQATQEYQAWIAYFRGPQGLSVLERSSGTFHAISIFAVQFDSSTRLVPASPWVTSTISELAQTGHPPFRRYVTVVNDIREGAENLLKDPQIIHDVLATPEARARHIQDLLPWSTDVDGLDIDYENLRKEDGKAFSLFIEDLARALHGQGKRLSVTLEPKTDRSPGDRAKAFDWKRIAASADEVRVMAYFYHSPRGSPGPTAPLGWLKNLAQFALEEIPAPKLTIALTVNGLDWPLGGRGRGIRFHEVEELIARHGVQPQRDPRSQSPYLRYELASTVHEVWYEDAVSLHAKIRCLQEEGIRSIGFWQLGSGDPAFWQWLNSAGATAVKNSSKSDPQDRLSRHSSLHF